MTRMPPGLEVCLLERAYFSSQQLAEVPESGGHAGGRGRRLQRLGGTYLLLLRLFASVDNEESGMLSLRFFKHGAWRTVLVDTMLPCLTGGPAFCHGASGLELWPSVLLKAYAKMHGGYAKLSGGVEGDALVDLTGGALSRELMPQLSPLDADGEREAKLAQVWGLVREMEHSAWLPRPSPSPSP